MIRRPNKLETGGMVLLSTAALLLGAACGRATVTPCESPRSESPRYHAAVGSLTARALWPGIAVITGKIPQDTALVASYRNLDPTQPDIVVTSWVPSRPIDRDYAGQIVLRVGDGPVQFSTHYETPLGSASCMYPPDSSFPEAPTPAQNLAGFAPTWIK